MESSKERIYMKREVEEETGENNGPRAKWE